MWVKGTGTIPSSFSAVSIQQELMDLFGGVDQTLIIQSLPGPFLAIMQIISLFGEVEVYLILLPAVYWIYDPGLGIRLALITS